MATTCQRQYTPCWQSLGRPLAAHVLPTARISSFALTLLPTIRSAGACTSTRLAPHLVQLQQVSELSLHCLSRCIAALKPECDAYGWQGLAEQLPWQQLLQDAAADGKHVCLIPAGMPSQWPGSLPSMWPGRDALMLLVEGLPSAPASAVQQMVAHEG